MIYITVQTVSTINKIVENIFFHSPLAASKIQSAVLSDLPDDSYATYRAGQIDERILVPL